MSYKGLRACRVLRLSFTVPTLMTSCWLLGNPWTWMFLINLHYGQLAPLVSLISLSFRDYSSQLKELLHSTAHNHSRCWISNLWIAYPHHSQLPSLHSGGHDEVFFHQRQWPWPIVSITRQPFTLMFSSHQLGLAKFNYLCQLQEYMWTFQATAFTLGLLSSHLVMAFLIIWSKPWVVSCAYQLYIQTLSNLLAPLSFKLS